MKGLNYFLKESKHNKIMKDCFFKDSWSAMYCQYVLRSTIPKNVVTKCSNANVSKWYKKIPKKLKKNKRYTPKKGDLIFFNFSRQKGSKNCPDHIGFVKSYNKKTKTIETIEGDCQVVDNDIFATRVQIHKYNMKSSWIHGYVKTI